MAKMIPSEDPVQNDSHTAEPDIYWRLFHQLDDNFTVIHSLPWLAAAATEIDGRHAPTGEIDFLILHPQLGILAIEVKGGRLKYDRNKFIQINTNEIIDPVTQVRRGTHGLAKWIKGSGGPAFRIGYAITFPHSDMGGRNIPPSLVDYTGNKPENICIDINQVNKLGERVIQIMRFWQRTLANKTLSQSEIDNITNLICPTENYSQFWSSRIEFDKQTWLALTPEQSQLAKRLQSTNRCVITGRSGTGKTVIAMNYANQLAQNNKKVLFVVYNVPLMKHIRKEIKNDLVEVTNFHDLCRVASRKMNYYIPTKVGDKEKWFKEGGPNAFRDAINSNKMQDYDALVIDEGQVIDAQWLRYFNNWFTKKPILICCDETQAFIEFEALTKAEEIASIIEAAPPFLLSVNLRSPKAVFNRLQETQPAQYQQISLREFEQDTLEEVAVLDPLMELYRTLIRLEKDGIPKEAITIVYTKNEPDYTNEYKLSERANEITSIYKFRGLEAPIIIVWVVGRTQDNPLACAYARATSRCIVIYEMFSLMNWRNNSDFLRILLKSPSAPASLFETINSIWPLENILSITKIIQQPNIFWSYQWGCWISEESETTEPIIQQLWIAHIILTSNFPVLSFGQFDLSIKVINPSPSLEADLETTYENLWWCERCNRWTRYQTDSVEKISSCSECSIEPRKIFPPSNEVTSLNENVELISNLRVRSVEEKRKLSLPLFALGYYLTLNSQQRKLASEHLGYWIQNSMKHICRVLMTIDIVKLQPNEVFSLEDMRNQHLKWYPSLRENNGAEKWKKWTGYGISSFLSDKWIEKQAKGIYRRLSIKESNNDVGN